MTSEIQQWSLKVIRPVQNTLAKVHSSGGGGKKKVKRYSNMPEGICTTDKPFEAL